MLFKGLQCILVISIFIKLNFLIRVFDQFSFLVHMLQSVFWDLRFFLAFFGIFVVSFSLLLSVILKTPGVDYQGIDNLGYFAIAFRTSIGDFDFESFSQNSDYKLLTWCVWLLIMIVGNVVFMNFIIAVVS